LASEKQFAIVSSSAEGHGQGERSALPLDLLPTKWDGTILLARSKNNKFLSENPSTKGH
jgi:hypothetical protein